MNDTTKAPTGVANDLEECRQSNGISIPPAAAHAQSQARSEYIDRITIPLNNVPAWTPTKRLRIGIIGAGYSGMVMAQKLQHKYADEMSKLLDFVIYEARSTSVGTWDANRYPGVRCDVPSMIYAVSQGHTQQRCAWDLPFLGDTQANLPVSFLSSLILR